MAIARGAGTEIVRSAFFEDVANTTQNLIIGAQHHVYTVLSATFFCIARSGTEKGYFKFTGFDAFGGTSAQAMYISYVRVAQFETFVWNDKFSFNGCEPVDEGAGVVGQMTTIAEQDALADQGTATSQLLTFSTDSANTKFDISITFIDQNNA